MARREEASHLETSCRSWPARLGDEVQASSKLDVTKREDRRRIKLSKGGRYL